jgi:hypothetical protein
MRDGALLSVSFLRGLGLSCTAAHKEDRRAVLLVVRFYLVVTPCLEVSGGDL